MAEPMSAVLVLLVFGGMGAAIFFVVRAQKREEAARQSHALLRGWTYAKEAGSGGAIDTTYTSSCGQGPWTLRIHQGRKGQHASTWTCPDAGIGGDLVWVGNSNAATVLKNPAAAKMVTAAFRLAGALGVRRDGLSLDALASDRAVLVEFPEGPFKERFAVVATEAGLARKLVSDEVQRALLEWDPGGAHTFLTAAWSRDGFSLHWPFALSSPEDLDRFVTLGTSLSHAGRGPW